MKAPTAAASSNASAAADARAGSMRTSLRHNDAMRGLSQLEEFAMTHRPRPEPGVEVIDTPRYVVRIVALFPIPGPNSASFIRCAAEDVDEVIDGVEAVFAERNLPYNWILDPDTQPSDLEERLQARGIVADPVDSEAAVMVLPADAELQAPVLNGLMIEDSLRDLESFTAAERVAAEAFAGLPFGEPMPMDGTREQRFLDARAYHNRKGILATVAGEPAGSASVTLFPPDGAIINAGAVRPRFRGLGVYRAMVGARLAMARDAGAAGLVVWGGHMSAPILARLGFEKVSWRRFCVKG